MEMTILERDDNISHVALAGRLDATSAEEIDGRFSEAIVEPNRPAIVDLSQIEFMASRGIGMLFANSKRLKKAGHKLVLLNPQGMVEGVLKSSKMDKVMPIAYDLNEAIVMVGGDPSRAAAAAPAAAAATAAAGPGAAAVAAAAAAELKVMIKNEISQLDTLNKALHQFLDDHSVPSRAAYAVDLAIEELVINVIRYAYMDDDEHLIDVRLAIQGDQLVLELVDDGRPFDPREGPEFNPHAEDREVGGLGLILVLDLVDALKYQRVDDKNRVEVRVSLIAEEGTLSPAAAEESGD